MNTLKNQNSIANPARTHASKELRRWIAKLKADIERKHSGIDRGANHLWDEIVADKALIKHLSSVELDEAPAASGTEAEAAYLDDIAAQLVRGFSAKTASIRSRLAFILRDVVRDRAIHSLEEQLDAETDADVRSDIEIAIESVAARRLQPVLDRIANGTVEERRAALTKLRATDDQARVLPVLEAATRDEDAEVRASALCRIAGMSTDQAHLQQLLATGLLDESGRVRASAVSLLNESSVDERVVMDALRNALTDDDESVRFRALSALKTERVSRAAVPALLSALHDVRVQKEVAELLRIYGAEHGITLSVVPEDVLDLTRRLTQSKTAYPDHAIAGELAMVLGMSQDPAAIPVLRDMALTGHRTLYEPALSGFSYIERREAIEAAISLLNAQSHDLRRRAASHLGYREDPAARGPLQALLDDPHEEVREAARKALQRIPDEPVERASPQQDLPEDPQTRFRMVEIALADLPPYVSFGLEDVTVAFAGKLHHGDLDDYEYFVEQCGGEIADSVGDAGLVILGSESSEAEAAARAAGTPVLSEDQFLNLTGTRPASASGLIEKLVQSGFDITPLSNEGDGFCETIDAVPRETSDADAALLDYAREMSAISREFASLNAKDLYRPDQLAARVEDYMELVAGAPDLGWVAAEDPERFRWTVRAYSDDTIVSGVSLLDALGRCVDDITVLKVVDRPVEDNISSFYLCGGFDDRGHLVGFVLKQVLT